MADPEDGWSPADITNVALVVFFGIATVVVAVLIYKREKRRISVDFSVLSDIKLVSSSTAVESFSDQIEVTYKGRTLRHPRIVDVKVKNTGNTPIRGPEAYDQPIVIELEDNYRPVEAAILAESSESLTGDIFATQPNGTRTIAIRPSLMNEGDWFIIRMLFDNNNSAIVGSHRIVGAPAMRQLDEARLSGYRRVVSPFLYSIPVVGLIAATVSILLTNSIIPGILFGGLSAAIWCLIAGFVSWFFLPKEAKGSYLPPP